MKAELLPPGRPALLTAFSLPGYGGNSGRGGGGNNYSGGASYNTGSHGGYGGGSGGGGSSYQGKQGQYTILSYISFHARAASAHPRVLLPGSGSRMGGKVPILRRNSFLLLFHAVMVTERFSLPFSTPPPSAGGYSSQSNYNSPGSGQNYSGPPSSYQASQGGYGRNDHSMNYQYR